MIKVLFLKTKQFFKKKYTHFLFFRLYCTITNEILINCINKGGVLHVNESG
jgi:hypothetical protein